ncbi:MAG: type II toxin-antitoxin system HicA family toxin [Chlamydiales bacterium]
MTKRKLPRITGKEVIKILKKAGFSVVRVKGSHHFLQHEDGRCTVVPMHSGEVIGPGLIHKILSDVDMSIESFSAFL